MLFPLDLLLPGEGVIGCEGGGVSASELCNRGSAARGEDDRVRVMGYAPGVIGYAPGMEYVEFCKKKSGVEGRPCWVPWKEDVASGGLSLGGGVGGAG